ncbi:hypothetical protein L2744_07665 [Shewanella profunda]|uniref:hypothetical protein n=1 Tax=Shewanella profunda TaxID=254793 RepID=UPI00200D0D54|nr:hypothetical protein [Shewanella profunda]MCL1089483.1 hypothetical protein [Shewanella profunda]
MKKHKIDKRLDKWCKKQAKKILKKQAKLTKARAKSTFSLTRSYHIADKVDRQKIHSKKTLRKRIAKLLAVYISNHPITHLDKSALKKQLKLAKATFIAANDAKLSSSAVIRHLTPLPSERSFALRPYKKSPCGGCPALKGKLCKCALKVIQRRQAS